MPAYYNEIDSYAAQWLRNLIAAGHIAPGDVDERSITEVRPDDLRGYRQCHFFAGIGGWSLALRLAGWPDARPVWTGSCPGQPFSAAGRQRGSDDERHLWPAFFDLIRECRPAIVFGEQVAGAAGLAWLDHVCADLEGAGYAAAAAGLCAAGAGAFHIRQRLYWVAHDDQAGLGQQREHWLRQDGDAQPGLDADRYGQDDSRLADADGKHASAERQQRGGKQRQQPQDGGTCELADSAQVGRRQGLEDDAGRRTREGAQGQPGAGPADDSNPGLLGNADNEGLEIERRFPGVSLSTSGSGAGQTIERADALAAWADIEWIKCSDGKARPTQPGLFPLAHGISNRVGRLRAYGNAIVPQVAAVFVIANM